MSGGDTAEPIGNLMLSIAAQSLKNHTRNHIPELKSKLFWSHGPDPLATVLRIVACDVLLRALRGRGGCGFVTPALLGKRAMGGGGVGGGLPPPAPDPC